MKGETGETFRSHYLAHSSIPRLSQLLQQLIGYHTSIHFGSGSQALSRCAYFVTQWEGFWKSWPKAHIKRAMLASTHVNEFSENPTDSGRARFVIEYSLPPSTVSEWVSVRAKQPSSSTVGHMKRSPKNTTTFRSLLAQAVSAQGSGSWKPQSG